MKQNDSQFVDNYVAAVQDEQSAVLREQWVNERLAQDFMRNAAATFQSGIFVLLITIFLLYEYVSSLFLGLWALAYAAVMLYRRYTLNVFKAMMAAQNKNQKLADIDGFFRRHGWSWPASGLVFALPIVLYYDKLPPVNQYLYLLILVGMGATGAALMSAHQRCQRNFSHALCSTAVFAVLLSWLSKWPSLPNRESMIFLSLIVLFWVLILYLGRHLHHVQRSGYSAQFGNEQLIRSLRQQTQAATEAVQTKNNLLASAAHDLRQPVHALAFYADWLRNEPQLAESVMPKILAATDSVNTLFNSLFDFARIEAGAIQINMGPVDVSALMEEMAVQFAPAADAKGLILSTQPASAVVLSDGVLLRRIVSNLLANAIRYTDSGSVSLAASLIEQTLVLEISDSGQGIAPDHLPHVFKEFYRAPMHEGTADSFGLGLAIVQRLCRALGHTVALRSELGKGTTCRLEIRLFDKDQWSISAAAAALSSQMPKARYNTFTLK